MKQQDNSTYHYLDDEVYVTEDDIYSHNPKPIEKRKNTQPQPKRSLLLKMMWTFLVMLYGSLCLFVLLSLILINY